MKKSIKAIILGITAIIGVSVLVAGSLSGCAKKEQSETNDEVWQKIKEAYTYSFPLMIMDSTKTKMTNTVKATSKQAPENQLIHAEKLVTADFKDVVTPNVDTIYSQCFLNLKDDAIIFEKPEADRFLSVEVMDAYTNCVSILGNGGDNKGKCKYIFTGPNFNGNLPEDMINIKMPTNIGWILVRTICYNNEDSVNVNKIQSQMKVYSLTKYNDNKTDVVDEGTFDKDNNFVPVKHVVSLNPQEYFDRVNELLKDNPPSSYDDEIINKLKDINVGAGLKFDASILGDDYADKWKDMLTNLTDDLTKSCADRGVKNGSWNYYGDPIAQFKDDYDYRALVALAGLGANPTYVAVYPKTITDSKGERLNGANKYVIHFNKDELPPVDKNGFWSITAYDSSNNLLIDNEIDRYLVNDRSNLKINEDGSVDIYVQKDKPADDLISNWLPVCATDFHLYMRIYLPTDEVISNKWTMPTITKK